MNQWTAFSGTEQLHHGLPSQIALFLSRHPHAAGSVLVFDDTTGQQIDLDLRGSEQNIQARYAPKDMPPQQETSPASASDEQEPRSVGRPKLGVVAREVTLLPQHWEWLSQQQGGASVTLRKLVNQARKQGAEQQAQKQAQQACDAVMRALLGNAPNYEEAARALYAGHKDAFFEFSQEWPIDCRDYLRKLAAPVWA